MDNLVEDLLPTIECPVCNEYMIPPIIQCSNGHNICEICKPGLAQCPTCTGTFLENVRNHTAEIVSRSITHACRYRKSGCTGHFLVDFIKEHENVCWFMPNKCPFDLVIKCDWQGPLIDLEQHFNKTHSKGYLLSKIDGSCFKIYVPSPRIAPEPHVYCQAINIVDEFFLFHCKVMDNVIYITLMFVGEEKVAKCYSYHVTLKATDDVPDTMSAHLRCRSFLQFNKDVIQKRFYAVFPVQFAENCIDKTGKFQSGMLLFDFTVM